MYCMNCGNKVSSGDVYCQKCGQKINKSSNNESNRINTNGVKEYVSQNYKSNAMIREYKCKGGLQVLSIIYTIMGFLFLIVGIVNLTAALDMKTYWGGEDEKRTKIILAIFVIVLGAWLVAFSIQVLQTKLCIYREYIEMKAMTKGLEMKVENLKLDYYKIDSVSVHKHFVIINVAGKDYKVSCGSEKDAKQCRNEVDALMKQNS